MRYNDKEIRNVVYKEQRYYACEDIGSILGLRESSFCNRFQNRVILSISGEDCVCASYPEIFEVLKKIRQFKFLDWFTENRVRSNIQAYENKIANYKDIPIRCYIDGRGSDLFSVADIATILKCDKTALFNRLGERLQWNKPLPSLVPEIDDSEALGWHWVTRAEGALKAAMWSGDSEFEMWILANLPVTNLELLVDKPSVSKNKTKRKHDLQLEMDTDMGISDVFEAMKRGENTATKLIKAMTDEGISFRNARAILKNQTGSHWKAEKVGKETLYSWAITS